MSVYREYEMSTFSRFRTPDVMYARYSSGYFSIRNIIIMRSIFILSFIVRRGVQNYYYY